MNKNLLGRKLKLCSDNPLTGWKRDGYCSTDKNDHGTHIVCARVTNEFLKFTKSRGNDLITSTPYFSGLKEGDKWCLCVSRWIEAYLAGVAPYIDAEATNIATFRYLKYANIPEEELNKYILK
jgi:uncharacterized protein (DUF2237 family)